MKTQEQIRVELHDELVRDLVESKLALEEAHLWEPLKRQDKLCAQIAHIEQRISLLEKMR